MKNKTAAIERKTRQRDAILHVMRAADRPIGPMEILRAARRRSRGIGIATVYRNLKILAAEKILTVVEIPGAPPRYEISGKNHHHHFHCRRCDRLYEVEGCPKHLKRLTPRGFIFEDHDLTLYGVCAACA